MRFEKWNALGNDYAIVEADALPFELSPVRIRALCHRHSGPGADGILLLSKPAQAGFVADLRIFNPDGSEAELSGNGAREAAMYLRHRGWTEQDEFSINTVAGEVRPRLTGPATCTMDMGRAKLASPDFPGGPDHGRSWMHMSNGADVGFQHVSVGNPQCAIEVTEGLESMDLPAVGPEIETHELFPNRTNVSFWTRIDDSTIRVRIFERGVGETLSSGTGASGAAVAAVLRGVENDVTVRLDGGELQVSVGEDLHVDLTGWAVPVYAAELSERLVAELKSLG